jgi:hypothetical protein
MVVGYLTKDVDFIPLTTQFTTSEVMYKLHGIPHHGHQGSSQPSKRGAHESSDK